MEDILKKVEEGKALNSKEVSEFYKGYNEKFGTLERSDGTMAKVVNLHKKYNADKTEVQTGVALNTHEKVLEPKKEK